MEINKKITYYDACCGAGGFRALDKLGFECVGSCDIDYNARKFYHANFGEWPRRDMRRLGAKDIPDHDLFVCGFPCQSFSIAGHRRGFEDVRGTIFFEIVRILREKRPRAFLLENVKGILSHGKKRKRDKIGETFKTILNLLARSVNGQTFLSYYDDCLDYNVFYGVLNSKDFGVPQNRERVFIVGFENEANFKFPRGEGTQKSLSDVLEENPDEKYYLSDRMVKALMEHRRRHEEAGHGFGFRVVGNEAHTLNPSGSGKETNLIANTISQRYHKDGSENLVLDTRGKKDYLSISKDCPTIRAEMHGNAPMIFQYRRTLYGSGGQAGQILDKDGLSKSIVPAKRGGSAVMPIIMESFYKGRDVREYEDESPTLRKDRQGLIIKLGNINPSNYRESGLVVSPNGISPAVRRGRVNDPPKIVERTPLKYLNRNQRNIEGDYSFTVDGANAGGIREDSRLRRLTPLECFRLQGFPDDFVTRAKKFGISDAQLYRLAGNAVTMNVVEALGKEIRKWM